jgi:hypothetical protein
MGHQNPPAAVEEQWETLLADAEAMADEYAEEGTEPFVVHAGDVTPLTGEPLGLDVLAPGDEFEALEELVADATFEVSHVYRTEAGATRLFVVVVEGSLPDSGGADPDVAVLVPAFLSLERAPPLEARAREAGVMYTHVRPLSNDARVTFTHDDPELFF